MLDLWSVRGQGWLKRIKKTLYWHLREREIVRGSSAVFFTLRRELENAEKTFHLPAIHPLIVTPYGLPPLAGRTDLEPSAGFDLGSERRIALFLGRVHPKKRPDILIESWARAGVPHDWLLVIAGPGEPQYLAKLLDLVRKNGVEDSVKFVGPVSGPDKSYLYQRASWFLLPSEQENFGIVVLEAVANECALAISDQVYLADELPGEAEVLPLEMEAWTRFMRERMTNDTWRCETVKRVREHIGDKFSSERVGEEWVDKIGRAIHNRLP
jgi:glycosyltransferase involved in cell wall biosynthesis